MKKINFLIYGLSVLGIALCLFCVKEVWKLVKNGPNPSEDTRSTAYTDGIGIPEGDGSEISVEEGNMEPTEKSEPYLAIETAMGNVSGTCHWGYKVFSTGEEYVTQSGPVPSASVIKVFIMAYAFDQMEQGKLSEEDTISGQRVDVLIRAMITRSDNDATNILIEKFGMENMNQFFLEQGYGDTKVQRRMLDTKAQSEGRDNFTSVTDVMSFLTKVYQNQGTEPYDSMLEIMKQQQIKTKIPRKFPGGVVIANKTGELSNVENDVGIIFGEKGDYAVVFLCSNLSDTVSARNAISDGAYNFYLAAEK